MKNIQLEVITTVSESMAHGRYYSKLYKESLVVNIWKQRHACFTLIFCVVGVTFSEFSILCNYLKIQLSPHTN